MSPRFSLIIKYCAMNPTEHSKLPFFAHFLESQNRQITEEGLKIAEISGELSDDAMTLKFPSDRDEQDPFK